MNSSKSLRLAALAELELRRRKRRDSPRHVFRGAALELQSSEEPEIMISGPAGTGKSIAALSKIDRHLREFPGARGLIARKTRASLTETGLATFETHVLRPGDRLAEGVLRSSRRSYRYDNGSELVVGGLDRPSRLMSAEFDFIFVQEATELQENDWELLTTRLRNGAAPFEQVLGDCNPGAPSHWIRQRSIDGRLPLLESRHEDNPAYFDEAGNLTEAGRRYIEKLDALTGVRYLRLRKGLWVAAEGVVYDEFDEAIHLLDRFDIPASWRRFRSVDFGYTNPFVCQFWALDPDDRMYLYREIYHTRRTVNRHSETILEHSYGEDFETTVCDHDAEDRATLEENSIRTEGAKKDISVGIQAVKDRLKIAGDGRPRLYILRDSLLERDPDLLEAKRPTETRQEIDGYVWSPGKETPVKSDDHGLDALRYGVRYADDGPGFGFEPFDD